MYVPSFAVRHNDTTINPLRQRRLVLLKALSKTSARYVYDNYQSRVVPYVSILYRLFVPASIHGANIICYVRGVYIVHDVNLVADPIVPIPIFNRDMQYVFSSAHRYVDVIRLFEDLLAHYSSHDVHPKTLVADLLSGTCLDTNSKIT